jgi:hypothetical protein
MNTKLTLQLDKEIIEKTKKYAKDHNQSLSGLVEDFFTYLTEESETSDKKLPSIVDELSGVIQLTPDMNINDSYTDYLVDKYK